MRYFLTFCAGLLTAILVPPLIEWVQFHRMMRDIQTEVDSTLDRMKTIVPPRPKEQQPDPSWRVVK